MIAHRLFCHSPESFPSVNQSSCGGLTCRGIVVDIMGETHTVRRSMHIGHFDIHSLKI